MQFQPPLLPARLLKRYKRFLADVELTDGQIITVHCPNTGAMTGCAEPGFQVWLNKSDNPKRKYPFTWELSQNLQGDWIGINTTRANALVAEALAHKKIAPMMGFDRWQQEVKYGEENSRVDFVLENAQHRCYMEVKSVTLAQGEIGSFPDAVTLRGQKHLRELTYLAQQGKRACLLYLIQHTGIKKLDLNSAIDPEYNQLLQQANLKGVEILAFNCLVNQEKIELNQPVAVFL